MHLPRRLVAMEGANAASVLGGTSEGADRSLQTSYALDTDTVFLLVPDAGRSLF